MDRKNKVKEAFDKFSDAVRVLLVYDDKSCHLELARMLQECGCDVTPCKGAENALDRLRKDTSGFDIMIIERNLLDMELLQKVQREMDLFVIAVSRDAGFEATQNNTITIHCNGTLKDITMNFLVMFWQCAVGKNIRNPAEVQQPTNDVPEAKRRRFDWSKKDSHKIFTDCVKELEEEGKDPTPKQIMDRMEAKGVEGLTIDIVKSHKQKWGKKLKKEVPQSDMQGYNDKNGPTSVHVLESPNSANQQPGAPTAMNSQPQIGALQIMTQPSSSRQIRNDLLGGQAFDDGTSINASTNLPANNPQNQDLDETMLDSFDGTDLYSDLSNFPSSLSPNSYAFTILPPNNSQNQHWDETTLDFSDGLDAYCYLCQKDTIPGIDLWK